MVVVEVIFSLQDGGAVQGTDHFLCAVAASEDGWLESLSGKLFKRWKYHLVNDLRRMVFV